MDLFFLEAKFPLVKTLEKQENAIKETPYPMARMFTSYQEDVKDISEFKQVLELHASKQRVMLKGALNHKLEVERRKGATDPFTRTSWICLDLDSFSDKNKLPLLLDRLGLSETSFILQYSSKHNIDDKFKAHLFFMLERPVLPEQLKLWLVKANLEIPILSDNMSLTRTAAALRWPLDISLAQNDKLIYIAPPRFINMDDPVKERIKLVVRKDNRVDLTDQIEALDATKINEQKQTKLTELRKANGLKARKFNTKTVAGVEIVSNPGETMVTGKKSERGFMYLNLNGGDSWGYYHPIDNPEIIYNFKGEPNYLTKELIPSYYRAYKKAEMEEQQGEDGDLQHFAFLDRKTDRYYRGTFDPSAEDLEIYSTGNKEKVLDFLKQNQIIVPDYIEEWDYLFRFDDDRIFVPEEKFVNQFRASQLLRKAQGKKVTKFPPTIKKVLLSVSGNNIEVMKHLVNWMAVIIQKRQRTQTMWVMHGVPGTGKGVLVHEILSPILGQEYVQVKSLSSLEEEYNHYMEKCLILMIDESKRTQLNNEEKVMAKLKQACTDPHLPIRKMRADPYMAANYMNIIIASNYPDPITVEAGDRRINVADYQKERLYLDGKDIERIRSELPEFAAILCNIKVDVEKAKTPLENEARRRLMYLTQNSLQLMFGAIREGNLQYFIDSLPTDSNLIMDSMTSIDQDAFVRTLREAEQCAISKETHKLSRDQVRVLGQYTLHDMPKTANKFSALAKHYGIIFNRMSKDGRKIQGIEVNWNRPEVFIDDIMETQKLRAVK